MAQIFESMAHAIPSLINNAFGDHNPNNQGNGVTGSRRAPQPKQAPKPKSASKASQKAAPKAASRPAPKPAAKPAPAAQASEAALTNAAVKTVLVYHTLKPSFPGKVVGYKTLGDSQPSNPYAAPHSSSHYGEALGQSSTHAALVPTASGQNRHGGHAAFHSTTMKTASLGLIVAHSSQPFSTPTNLQSSSSQSPTSSSSSSGMSTGAKVGLAIGIIVGLAFIIGLIVFLVRRHRDEKDGHERLADEKAAAAAPTPFGPPRVNVRSHDDASGPPRLSMRPLTDLFPQEKAQTTTYNGLLAPADAANNNRSASPVGQPNQNSYEMRTRDTANDPSNPFGNHAETVNGGSQRGLAAGVAVTGAAVAGAAAASLSPKPLSIRSANSGRNSPEPARTSPPSRSASPAMGPAGFAGAGGRPGPSGARGPPPGPNNVHRVQLDFKPSMEDELELRAGQVVRMLHEYDDGWALCIRLDRSQQGVVPRTCISKHPVRPRPPPGMRGPQQGPPRSMSPADGMSSGRSSPAFDSQGRPRGPPPPGGRQRSYSNSPRPGPPPRSMSPGPGPDGSYSGRPDSRRRSNSAGGPYQPQRGSPPEGGRMNPSAFNPQPGARPPMRKPVAGQAI